MSLKAITNACSRTIGWVWHHCVWVTAIVLLLAAASVMTLRYGVLPNIDQYRERIAAEISIAAGQKVTIGHITADWDGLHPRLNLSDVVVHDKAGQAALTLKRVDSTLSWLSVPLGHPHFRALDFYEPHLSVRRNKAGQLSIGGIAMDGESGDGSFSDWVLAQRDIEIHDATIAWNDEMRGAPLLELSKVSLQLVNNGERHRFGLRATPPANLASVLDIRGDLYGKSARNLPSWGGRMYANLDYTDIAAWRAWVAFPFELTRGAGGLRAWVSVRDQAVRDLVADVKLNNVRTRLGKELPELDLTALNGRFTWKRDSKSLDFTATKLALTTAGNLKLQPMDVQYRAALNDKAEHISGELKASALDIAPMSSLAEHLPIAPDARKVLAELAPQGTVHNIVANWQGALPNPAQYHAHTRFENLSFKRRGTAPGLTGLSGTVEASEKNGKFEVKSNAMRLDMPDVFKAPLDFNKLTAAVNWTRDNKGIQIKLGNIAFANGDLEGSLAGTYQSSTTGPGTADIAGKLTRADARQLMRYMPITVARGARPWMDAAFLAGSSNDVQFKVKGDLYQFPFVDDRNGQFYVTAKVSGAKLHYGEGWPDIDRIDGDLAFRGSRMNIDARQGFIDGVRLSGVKADIADMASARHLIVTGGAEGTTPDFFKFIAASPVGGYINHFTEGMQGEGPGRLRLRLDLPLLNLTQTKVAGAYQVTNNRLVLDPGVPPFEQVTGRLEFNETGFNVPQATANFFGGPMTVNGAMQRDGSIRMNLGGRINPEITRKAGGPQWLAHVRGASDWRGAVTVRNKTMDLTVESSLQGMAIDLPAPFGKTADLALPVKLERRFLASGRDQLALNVSDLLNAKLHRHSEGTRTIIDRGMVRVGGGDAAEPTRPGVFISGALKALDADAWLKFLGVGSKAPSGKSGGTDDVQWTIAGLDVSVGTLALYNRQFNALSVKHNGTSSGNTHYVLNGREVDGVLDWNGPFNRLVAHFKTLAIPTPHTNKQPTPNGNNERPAEWDSAQFPSLDITADNFTFLGKSLGKLELQAAAKERDWYINKLMLTQADESYLRVDGVWQSWSSNPRTRLNIDWKVLNVGKTLTRLGYVDGVRQGSAEIGGTLSWLGGPQAIDYSTLDGKLTVRAIKGQFARMEPGIGRLLGVLSLQSLPRRLSLDFRDIFSDGLAFDEILSEVKIDHGIAMSDRFAIDSPSARIVMNGAVDLNRETQTLQVRVNPRISDSAAIVTAIFLPLPALIGYVANKLAKDPLDGLFAFRYTVTGTWADPVVTRITQPSPDAPAPAP